jgi:glycosyltransferase involved in cell wall biosynthesis
VSAAAPVVVPSASDMALSILAAARSLPFHAIGGMQSVAWDVFAGLARRGHRLTVLTTSIPGRANEPFQHEGVLVVPLARTAPGRYSAGWWNESRRYVERHTAQRVDAVLSVSSAAAGLLPLKRSRLPVPFLFQAHGTSWAEAVAKWKSRRPIDWVKSARNIFWLAKDAGLYRNFDQLILVGAALERQFEERPLRWMTRGVARTTIANGIDTERFRADGAAGLAARTRFGFAADDRVVVFAARLHPHKGAAEALRALAVLRAADRRYKLLVIGDGAASASLRALAHDLSCIAAVTFAGGVQRSEMPALLAAGNVFVFPALGSEGLPLNVLEALSVGLPCVCAETLRSIFGRLPHVTYAAARDAVAFAAAVERVALPEPPTASLLPREHSLVRCIDAYETVIRRCAKG